VNAGTGPGAEAHPYLIEQEEAQMEPSDSRTGSDRKRWRWPPAVTNAAWLTLSAGCIPAYHPLYEIARATDTAFLANLDAISILGLPLAGIMVALTLAQERGISIPLAPDPTVLYRLYDSGGTLLYVGITRRQEQRMRQHSQTKPWWPEVTTSKTRLYRTRVAAARAEHAAILREDPRHNVARLTLDAHLRTAAGR
jgi:predicted GIY-YIG superfamily endonuclease